MQKILKTTTFLLIALSAFSFTSAESMAFIRRGKLKQRNIGGFRAQVIVVKKVGELATATATISKADKEAPTPKTTTFDLKLTSKTKKGNYQLEADMTCERGICLFSKDQDPIGHNYKLTVTFKDKNGKQIGSPESIDVLVELDKSTCATSLKIKEIGFNGIGLFYPNTRLNSNQRMLFTTSDKGEETPTITWSPFLGEKNQCTTPPEMDLEVEYTTPSNKNLQTYTTRAVYDEKSNTYTAKWTKADSAYTYSFWIRPTGSKGGWKPLFKKPLFISNHSYAFKAKKRNEEDDDDSNNSDSAKVDFSIGQELKLSSTVIGKLQVINLSEIEVINKDTSSDIIAKAKAIVFLKTCNGKDIQVSIELKYNPKTGSYTGNQSLPLCNSKGSEIESVTIIAEYGGTLWTRAEVTHF
jgi:hypothetical protein